MQQFQVPQFIDVKDKIFGPFTVKQFIYILGGVGVIVIAYLLDPPAILFWLIAVPVGAFSLSLALWKPNGQEFDLVINNAINHFLGPRLYIWKKEEMNTKKSQKILQDSSSAAIPKLSQRKLQDLAWSLDINSKFKR